MNRRVAIRKVARDELADAADFYDSRREGLGDELVLEIDDLLLRAAEHPERRPILHGRIRKSVAKRIPFVLLFIADEDEILVVGIRHTRRKPRPG